MTERPVFIDHVTIRVRDLERSRAFYRAAASGEDNGPPGLRPEYHAGYDAAYALDPDGHDVEAVFHDRSADASSQRA